MDCGNPVDVLAKNFSKPTSLFEKFPRKDVFISPNQQRFIEAVPDLAQTMYFFEGSGNKKIVVTCTAPAKFESGREPLFDACMKTFLLSTR
jgi:hypothetical protein